MTTTESRTRKEIIGVDGRQDVARFPEISLSRTETLLSREGVDDWFVLLDFAREQSAPITPPGTSPPPRQRLCVHCVIYFRVIYFYVSVSAAVVQRVVRVAAPSETKPTFVTEVMGPRMTLVDLPQSCEVDDDWFVLLDAATEGSGTLLFDVSAAKSRNLTY